MNEHNTLDKNSNAVIYRQLADLLRARIMDGTLADGARLPTEMELAEKHNLSRSTVRQALNLLVNEGLIERIAGRGSFVVPHTAAESPGKRPPRQIGIIGASRVDQLSTDIIWGVERVLKMRNYTLALSYTGNSLADEKTDIERLKAAGVDGLIIIPTFGIDIDANITALAQQGFPLVLVDHYFTEPDTDYVVADNFQGGFSATEHLIHLGHNAIQFAPTTAGEYKNASVRERYRGYRRALEEYEIEFQNNWGEPIAVDHVTDDLCRAYLQRPTMPRAIFAINDYTAMLLLRAAVELHIQVPQDLAIVGFDNLQACNTMSPPLTSVNQPFVEIGSRAAHLLLDRIEGYAGPPEHISIPTYLIVRDSCGARWQVSERLRKAQMK